MGFGKLVALFLLSALSVLIILPTPKGIEPQDVDMPSVVEIASLDIPKNRFENAKFITTPAIGPEDIVIDNDGNIYSGLSDGSIIRVSSNGQQTEVIGKS